MPVGCWRLCDYSFTKVNAYDWLWMHRLNVSDLYILSYLMPTHIGATLFLSLSLCSLSAEITVRMFQVPNYYREIILCVVTCCVYNYLCSHLKHTPKHFWSWYFDWLWLRADHLSSLHWSGVVVERVESKHWAIIVNKYDLSLRLYQLQFEWLSFLPIFRSFQEIAYNIEMLNRINVCTNAKHCRPILCRSTWAATKTKQQREKNHHGDKDYHLICNGAWWMAEEKVPFCIHILYYA